jgi:ATP-dependent Lhr-like helicase
MEDASGRRVRATRIAPISIFLRENAGWLPDVRINDPLIASEDGQLAALSHSARDILRALSEHGASFFGDLARATGRLASEVEDALWELVAAGLVTADGFENLRALIDPKRRRGEGRGRERRPRHAAGRWALMRRVIMPQALAVASETDRIEAFADQLILRWGVLFRDLLTRETTAPFWRDLLPILRRKEARGELRGGRFVSGLSGEQFASPEALDLLRSVRRAGSHPEDELSIANADPLNLTGIILPGPRVSTITVGSRVVSAMPVGV